MEVLDLAIGLMMGTAVAIPFGLVNTLMLKNLGSSPEGKIIRHLVIINLVKLTSYALVVFTLYRVEQAMAAGAVLPFMVQIGITSFQVLRSISRLS